MVVQPLAKQKPISLSELFPGWQEGPSQEIEISARNQEVQVRQPRFHHATRIEVIQPVAISRPTTVTVRAKTEHEASMRERQRILERLIPLVPTYALKKLTGLQISSPEERAQAHDATRAHCVKWQESSLRGALSALTRVLKSAGHAQENTIGITMTAIQAVALMNETQASAVTNAKKTQANWKAKNPGQEPPTTVLRRDGRTAGSTLKASMIWLQQNLYIELGAESPIFRSAYPQPQHDQSPVCSANLWVVASLEVIAADKSQSHVVRGTAGGFARMIHAGARMAQTVRTTSIATIDGAEYIHVEKDKNNPKKQKARTNVIPTVGVTGTTDAYEQAQLMIADVKEDQYAMRDNNSIKGDSFAATGWIDAPITNKRANVALQALLVHAGMTTQEAKEITVASLRHTLPEIGHAARETNADTNELGGWRKSATARTNPTSMTGMSHVDKIANLTDMRIGIMSKRYATESQLVVAAAIKKRQIKRCNEVLCGAEGGIASLPKFGGWEAFLPPELREIAPPQPLRAAEQQREAQSLSERGTDGQRG